MDTPMGRLKAAMVEHAKAGETLVQGVRRWLPDPQNPGKSVAGDDLDSHPADYRTRRLKEAQAAIRSHDTVAVRVLNPLIAEAEKEPANRWQHGSALSADARSEAGLLAQQYQGLTRKQQEELDSLGLQAVERGDLQTALALKRAADVLHVATPELDASLAKNDPERVAGRAQLDVMERWVQTYHVDEARRHVRAGIADSVEQIGHTTWAQQHGFSEDSGSYVLAVLGE
jgi:hypothetical protein